ncbi:MAG: FKBP-type peptidyl-prolyl cis-trans isomerase [Proteobacteria bacterium]|nr:FKBP-type peptidyl-prolyl cis-trans isomerase [Pseudomonadota bacterium]MBU1685880.1 FKBP-type peptidyl-prolyl cis-trans isomerase [Pseudomonadota bacterium]
MRKLFMAVGIAVALSGTACATEKQDVDLSGVAAQQGYAIGYQLGSDFKSKNIEVTPEAMAAGVKAAMAGAAPAITVEQMDQVMTDLKKRVNDEQMALQQKALDENKQLSEKFMADNATKEGVITLPSGLQYKIITAGEGEKPTASSKVTVHYRGTLPDGTEFDSSYKRNQPATFQVNQVVAGWTEALQLMPMGSKWMLFLPSSLAYGERGAPPRIGPNQALIFEVELISKE